MKGTRTMVVGIGLVVAASQLACTDDAEFAGSQGYAPEPEVLFEEEFPAAAIAEASLTVNPRFGTVEEMLVLHEGPATTLRLKQAERPLAIDRFKQGHDGSLVEKEFQASENGPLDLLVVVDNSASMKTEQENLAKRFGDLTRPLAGTEWSITVVTTDDSCRRGGASIVKGDPDAAKKFASAVSAGINGSGTEKGIKMALRALDGKCSNGDYQWLREGSTLGILFISDEDSDCSKFLGRCVDGEGPDHLVRRIQQLKSNGRIASAKAYGLLWQKKDPNCVPDTNDEEEGKLYQEVIDDLGGFSGSICDADYGPVLETIAQDVSRVIRREYTLPHDPIADSIVVTADGALVEDYELSGRNLIVRNLPGDVRKLKISYRYGSEPKFDRFALELEPAPETLDVYVNGKLMDASAFAYDDISNEIVFADMPEDEAEIKVKYRHAVDLPRIFDIGSLPGVGEVRLGGRAVKDFVFDPDVGVLELPEAPLDGETVEILYRDPADKILQYVTGHEPDENLEGIEVLDDETGEPVPFSESLGRLVFDPADVFEGRRLRVLYSYGDGLETPSIALPRNLLPGSLEVSTGSDDPACVADAVIEGGQLIFGCSEAELGEATVTYRYVAALYDRFPLKGKIPSGAKLEVTVDGESVPFALDGSDVVLDIGLLDADSVVKVQVIGIKRRS